MSEDRRARGGSLLVATLLACAAALPFVVDVDAQWLKLDDFTMIEEFRGRPLGALVADVLLTRTTPHVRFAFLEHLLFLPFFRGAALDRTAVNVVFLLAVASIAAAGAALASTARRPLACAASFAALLPAIWGARAWSALEFKTALYLPLSFALAAALVAWSWRLGEEGRERGPWTAAGWAALGVAAFHMAEASLVAVFVAGLGLVARRRLHAGVLAFVTAWPLVYWAANKLIVPRPTNLLGSRPPGVATAGLVDAAWHAVHTVPALAGALAAALLAAAAVAVARGLRRSLPELLWIAALPASGAALLVLAQAKSYGEGARRYLADRHAFYVELCLAAGVALAVAWIAAGAAGRRAAAAMAIAGLALGGVYGVRRAGEMARYADLRRAELGRTFELAEHLRAARSGGRPVLVLVGGWRGGRSGGVEVDPTFLLAPWARNSFGRVFGCGEGACDRVEFVASADWMQPLDAAEREALCRRAASASVVVVTESGIASGAPPREPAACAAWLVRGGFLAPLAAGAPAVAGP